MKSLLILLVTLFLFGCATVDQVRGKVAGLYDQALESAETTICNDASVGSVLRRYGRSVERANEWRALCFGEVDAVHVIAAPPPGE